MEESKADTRPVRTAAARGLDAACLAALIVAPLFFNLRSRTVFESDKALLVRALALLLVALVGVWLGAGGWAKLEGTQLREFLRRRGDTRSPGAQEARNLRAGDLELACDKGSETLANPPRPDERQLR